MNGGGALAHGKCEGRNEVTPHENHKPSEEMLKEMDNTLSRLNAMEIVAADELQKDTIRIMRMLVEGQMHSVREFDHLKKAMDITLEQIFKVQNQVSRQASDTGQS